MRKMNFSIQINASPNKVWEVLWGDKTYNQWTKAFSESSQAVTDWQEGSKVLFTDGSGSGMVSMIAAKRPNEFMSFRHLGEVKDGVETVSEWAGSLENYTLVPENGGTKLLIEMDITEDFEKIFGEMWPKALENVRVISETSGN